MVTFFRGEIWRICINIAIYVEGLTGKPKKRHCPSAAIPKIADKPPDYDSAVFRRSMPEVVWSRTAGATDQAFLPERIHCNGCSVDTTTKWALVNGITLF